MATTLTAQDLVRPRPPPSSSAPPARSLWSDAFRQFRRHRLAMFGVGTFAFLLLATLIGPFVSVIDCCRQRSSRRMARSGSPATRTKRADAEHRQSVAAELAPRVRPQRAGRPAQDRLGDGRGADEILGGDRRRHRAFSASVVALARSISASVIPDARIEHAVHARPRPC